MELAKTDLLDYIKLIGRLNEDKARKMFLQLISAVDYLHQLNILDCFQKKYNCFRMQIHLNTMNFNLYMRTSKRMILTLIIITICYNI